MFQYTTETIINDNKGALRIPGRAASGDKQATTALTDVRFAAIDANGSAAGQSGTPAVADGVRLLIDGVGLFQKGGAGAGITHVTRRAYKGAVPENITILLDDVHTALTVKKVVRLKIETSQEGLVSSIYADAQLRHKKPFFYEIEFAANETAANIAAAFAAAINKEMKLTDFPFFKASVTGNSIVLTADDVYTRFQTVSFDSVPVGTITRDNLGNVLVGWQDFDPIIDWVRDVADARVTLVKGTEGNGTVARLIKNIKLPTDANTNPFAADNGGRPMPGATYDEYVIEYVSDRRHIGGQVVGALDKSLTTHVLWLAGGIDAAVASATGASKAFYDELVKLGISLDEDLHSASMGTLEIHNPAKVGSKQ